MGSLSLKAMTGDARATSTCGTPWVRTHRFTDVHTCINQIQNIDLFFLSKFAPGQYFETNDGSSSSLTVNTTKIPLGAEVMEVMVYRKRERRKYSPLSTDNTVFYVTGGEESHLAWTTLSVKQTNTITKRNLQNELLTTPLCTLSQIRSHWQSTSPRRLRSTSLRMFSSVARTWSSKSSSTTPAAT